MKAIVIHSFGSADVLKIEDLPMPVPKSQPGVVPNAGWYEVPAVRVTNCGEQVAPEPPPPVRVQPLPPE